MQNRRTTSDRCTARLADSRASAELPRRRTCGDPQEKPEVWEQRGGEQKQRKRKSKRVKVEQVIETKTNNFLKEQKQFILFLLQILVNLCPGFVFSNLPVSPALHHTHAPVVLPQWEALGGECKATRGGRTGRRWETGRRGGEESRRGGSVGVTAQSYLRFLPRLRWPSSCRICFCSSGLAPRFCSAWPRREQAYWAALGETGKQTRGPPAPPREGAP